MSTVEVYHDFPEVGNVLTGVTTLLRIVLGFHLIKRLFKVILSVGVSLKDFC